MSEERHLTPHQFALMLEGKALVTHCEQCSHVDLFLGSLPMEVTEMVKLTRKAKCPNDPKHRLIMGLKK
jgi:hypothetical protein